jgi:cytochrome c biogenesis protein CcdA/thiol-disulfide isomerase/thioredoxin
MVLFLLAYAGGILTIVSPCILPVLPFVFARSDQSFLRSGLPMLLAMTVAFASVATLAAVGGSWVVEANQYGRAAALVLLALFGAALLFPSLADRLAVPAVSLGQRLVDDQQSSDGTPRKTLFVSLALGIATGLLWAPCAGPILGLILTGAALNGANAKTSLLLAAYAAGAATSLALVLLLGGRVFAAMKKSLGLSVRLRQGIGLVVLLAVAAIALGLDTGILTRLSTVSTAAIEQKIIDVIQPLTPSASSVLASGRGAGGGPAMMSGNSAMMSSNAPAGDAPAMMMRGKPTAEKESPPDQGAAPSLSGAVEWLNTAPLDFSDLKGKVVLIDFWTYSCINCLRAIPYVRAWYDKYKDNGFVVIGVHTPEFAFERRLDNVRKAVSGLGIQYPVAVDNNYGVWRAFRNQYWPAHYFIDAQGRIRHTHFGEGNYDESERVIQQLLEEAGRANIPSNAVMVLATGVLAASNTQDVLSPETYIGYDRAENFISPGGFAEDVSHEYASAEPRLNEWSLAGNWLVSQENATLKTPGGRISYRFHARDLHLVLGVTPQGSPVRFRITIDGKAPGGAHGTDVDADGLGTVDGQRLYQLVRQGGAVTDHTFEIEFLDPDVQVYAFTFG